jgi:hypothetical protein
VWFRRFELDLTSCTSDALTTHYLSQVLVGPPSEEGSGHCNAGPCYFSLNNRRLWVLKRCREEGLLLPSNLVLVRVRQPKSAAEAARYTTANCALEATLMREPTSTPSSSAAYSSPTFSGPTAARRRTLTNQLTMVSRSADSDSGCNSNSELGMKETAVVDEGTREQSSDEASSHAESDCDSIAVSNRFAEFSLE